MDSLIRRGLRDDGGSTITRGARITVGGGETSSVAVRGLWEGKKLMELVVAESYKKWSMHMMSDLETF